jgi:hypothetical protein
VEYERTTHPPGLEAAMRAMAASRAQLTSQPVCSRCGRPATVAIGTARGYRSSCPDCRDREHRAKRPPGPSSAPAARRWRSADQVESRTCLPKQARFSPTCRTSSPIAVAIGRGLASRAVFFPASLPPDPLSGTRGTVGSPRPTEVSIGRRGLFCRQDRCAPRVSEKFWEHVLIIHTCGLKL